MIKLEVDKSLAEMYFLKAQLIQSGIDCIIKNAHLSGAIGELPVFDCRHELWLIHDNQIKMAESFLCSIEDLVELPNWTCSRCHEVNDGTFGICWKCLDVNE
jgi:hypothetical protein